MAQWCPKLVRVIVTMYWEVDVLSFKSGLSSILLTHIRAFPKTPLGRWVPRERAPCVWFFDMYGVVVVVVVVEGWDVRPMVGTKWLERVHTLITA